MAVRRPLQGCCHCVPSALAACCDLSFAESQTVEPEDLTVIGHAGDLLVDIYVRSMTHIYILSRCSTPAAMLLNSAGKGAQSQRSRCTILDGILSRAKRGNPGYLRGLGAVSLCYRRRVPVRQLATYKTVLQAPQTQLESAKAEMEKPIVIVS